MSFASYGYIFLFLPLTALLFWRLQKSNVAAALWLLSLASFVFYVQWNPRDILLIAASLAFNYHAARWILQHPARQKRIFATAVTGNLLVLGYFKYLGFITQLMGMGPDFHGLHLREIVLPLGISFFTFTQIAYLADCYSNKLSSSEHNPRDYILFVTFFPHLIAGPILHHANIIPQFHGKFRVDRVAKIQTGVVMFVIGLFKKVMIADYFSQLAIPVFSAAQTGHALTAFSAWKGALAYTLQIYFDFSGYSDMAVGSALLIGMHIPFNFHSPYKATSMIEFWRRWHISLSTFMRDYLYIPLGGSRHGAFRRYVNIVVTMLLGGIWHGAGMNFVIWGALHGVFITANHLWRDFLKPKSWNTTPNVALKVIGYLITMLAVIVGWIFFRAPSLDAAMNMLSSMMAVSHGMAPVDDAATVIMEAAAIFGGIMFTLALPNSRQLHDRMLANGSGLAWSKLGAASGMAAALSLIFISSDSPFLYFQF